MRTTNTLGILLGSTVAMSLGLGCDQKSSDDTAVVPANPDQAAADDSVPAQADEAHADAPPSPAQSEGDNPIAPLPPGVANDLDAFMRGEPSSGPFEVMYSDLHGLHGGIEVRLAGDGELTKRVAQPGKETTTQKRDGVQKSTIHEVIALLIETRAWEQQVEERPLNADESVAKLEIMIGDQKFAIWEHYNDMAQLRRLARIKALLISL